MTDADIKKIEKLLAGMPEWDNLTWGQSKSLHAAVPQMRAILARLKKAEKECDEARRSKSHQKSKAGYADRARRDNAAGIGHWKQMYDAVIEQSREDHSFHCAEADRLKTEIITLQADLADARHGWEQAAETIRGMEIAAAIRSEP